MSAAPDDRPRRAAVLGSPIAHSLSPVLHTAAYAELGLDWTYEAVEVGEGGLAAFLAGLDDTWAGLSLTMPLKREALDVARMRSDTVSRTGAANTLLPLGSGWSAENTDVPGLQAALAEAGVGAVSGAAILGGGATAASALVALARLGAPAVDVVVRRTEAARPLEALGEALGVSVRVRSWDDAGGSVAAQPLTVSTVPEGVADVLAEGLNDRPGVLFDVVYDPWPTALAAAWAARGGQVIGGLDLLVHQAALQVELMTGRSPVVATMRSAGLRALASRSA